MIFDTLNHSRCYHPLESRITQGLEWLTQCPQNIPLGRHQINGDLIYASVLSYETAPLDTGYFERHMQYLDIQFVAEGAEIILHAPTSILGDSIKSDVSQDWYLHQNPASYNQLMMRKGDFAIFWPQDGHKPGCNWDNVARVKKIVVKVLLNPARAI